ncbi:MAG TPA: 50S ribosomal protein L23 [Firmicutes bacterium]|nr:50S ribosomal protein L23 [Bacillota bacterium]
MEARDILIRPVVTEKSNSAMAENAYTFEVHKDADKLQIKRAVEELFKVTVLSVNTVRTIGKVKRMGRFSGRRPERKKAIVKLKQGDRIEIFEGL